MSDSTPGVFEKWPHVLGDLVAGKDLSRDLAHQALGSILAGAATEAQIGGFVIGLAGKGETTQEILGMRDAMLAASTPLELPEGAVDIVGVGGAPQRRIAAFNVSTLASIVASAAGATICKHGNRRASSTSGSFDLLEALGVNIEIPPDKIAGGVNEIGLGFAFARAHHPAMRHVGPARAQLGVPTVFNVLGPLSHPGRVKRQVIGVSDPKRAAQIADVVADTDAACVWVVHGNEDLDELTTTGPAQVIEIRAGERKDFTVDAAQIGLAPVDASAIRGGDAATNAGLARSVFAGDRSANRDMVVLNSAAGLVVGGVVTDIAEGVTAAAAAIDSGGAAAKLDALVRFTNR